MELYAGMDMLSDGLSSPTPVSHIVSMLLTFAGAPSSSQSVTALNFVSTSQAQLFSCSTGMPQ